MTKLETNGRRPLLFFVVHRKYYEATNDDEQHVKLSVYSVPDLARPSFDEATSHEFKPTSRGTSFGPSWSTHWFKIQLTVPEDMRSKERLEFHWDANCEGLVWTQDGRPLQGLTGGGERVEWALPDSFRDGKQHTFYIEMACNGMFGNANGDLIQPPNPNNYYQLNTARIVAVNVQARALYYDFWMIGGKCPLYFVRLFMLSVELFCYVGPTPLILFAQMVPENSVEIHGSPMRRL